MKLIRPAAVARGLALLLTLLPVAAVASTGVITGRVTNAATGNSLGKARVAVKGTDLVALTDDFGGYRLIEVPAGRAELEVFYTDLDPQTASVAVLGGGSVVRDFALTSRARHGDGTGSVVKLDRFTVASERETDARALATNE